MTLSLTALRRILIASVTMLVTLTVLWWGVWSLAAARYRNVIDGWIEAGRSSGYQIDYSDRQLFGFPRHVILRFVNLNWKNTDGISFHADDIDISAAPWHWQNFDAKFKRHTEIDTAIDIDHRSLVLGGEEGRAHVELNDDGTWKLSRISLNNARIGRSPDYLFEAVSLKAFAERPLAPPKDRTEPGLKLTGDATNVTLPDAMPSPFGNKMANLKLDMRVMDAVPDVRRRESVETWTRDMGVVAFDKIDMSWGPLIMSAQGALGFDDDLQPEGALSSVIGNHDEVLKSLMDHGFIAERQAGMLGQALSLFAKPAELENSESKGIAVPITIQLSGLFLGPVKIFTFPEIEWPTAPPPAP